MDTAPPWARDAGGDGRTPPPLPPPPQYQPGTDHGLAGLQPAIPAAQRPGRIRRQPAYLSGLLPRDRRPEPPFSPSGAEGASVPAAGLASQIFSFTSAICSQITAKSPCRATSRRTFSTSPAASCRPTVPRPRAEGAPGEIGRAHV